MDEKKSNDLLRPDISSLHLHNFKIITVDGVNWFTHSSSFPFLSLPCLYHSWCSAITALRMFRPHAVSNVTAPTKLTADMLITSLNASLTTPALMVSTTATTHVLVVSNHVVRTGSMHLLKPFGAVLTFSVHLQLKAYLTRIVLFFVILIIPEGLIQPCFI